MKNLYIAFLSVLLFSGCAQMFPAPYYGLGPGKYKIQSSGNVFATIPELVKKVERRAIDLCGEGKYEFQDDGDFSTSHSQAYVGGVDVGGGVKTVTRIVTCKT